MGKGFLHFEWLLLQLITSSRVAKAVWFHIGRAGHGVGRTLGFKHSPLLPLPASRLSSATHSSFHRNSPAWSSPGKNSPTKFSPEKTPPFSLSAPPGQLWLFNYRLLEKMQNKRQETAEKNGLHCQLPPQRFMPLRSMLLCLVKVPLEGKRRSKSTL